MNFRTLLAASAAGLALAACGGGGTSGGAEDANADALAVEQSLAAAPTEPGTWARVSTQNGTFNISGTRMVRFGAGTRWVYRYMTGDRQWCTVPFFGSDPAPGVAKTCEVFTPAAPTAPPTGTWRRLSTENGTFNVTGTQLVRYGADTRWVQRNMTGPGQWCTTPFFGRDPAPGVAKACEVLVPSTGPVTPPPPPPPVGTGPCSFNTTSAACKIDALAYKTVGTNNSTEEVVVAYGRVWRYDLNGQLIEPSTDILISSPFNGFSIGPSVGTWPCSRRPAGQTCEIDSLIILNHDQWGYVESVTAYGHGWNVGMNGVQWTGAGSQFDLTSVTRYGGGLVFGPSALGPCSYKPAGSVCKFDTRVFIDARPEWGDYYESITAYGRYFIYNSAGNLIGSNTLASVARYKDGPVVGPSAPGPCSYKPSGSVCKFDAAEIKRVNGALVETIIAYGRYWEFVDGSDTAVPGTGVELTSMARFR